MSDLQITTTPGQKSDHLVEFQLRMTAKDQPLSRLMALSLDANRPTPERIAAQTIPAPAMPKQLDPPERLVAPVPTAQIVSQKSTTPEPVALPEPRKIAAATTNTEAPAADVLPTKEPTAEPPLADDKSGADNSLRSAPARLAALIPKLWKTPKPVPSGLGASSVNPAQPETPTAKSEDRLAALPQADKPSTAINPPAVSPAAEPKPLAANPSRPPRTDAAAERAAPMFARAKRMAEAGDVAGARLLYAHLANSGNASAAFEMARTFEADFLQRQKVWGLKPDTSEAKQWYAKARELGYADAN